MKLKIGGKYGKLTILEQVKDKWNTKYRYRCECGNEGIRRGDQIFQSEYPSCGCDIGIGKRRKKVNQIINTIINNCKIINGYYLETEKGRRRLYATCECLQCHNTFNIRYDTLKLLRDDNCPHCNIKAMGELHKKPHREHKLWRVWWAIKGRCYNTTDKRYNDYGERGITMCNEWLCNFEVFYDWSMKNGYRKGLSIDRINNDGNYEPSNCRWVDQKTQCYNTRRNFFLWYKDKWRTVEEIAKIEHVSWDKVYYKYVTRKNTKLPRKQLYNIDNIKK